MSRNKTLVILLTILTTQAANSTSIQNISTKTYESFVENIVQIENSFNYIGTGFLVKEDIVITNRHVVLGVDIDQETINYPKRFSTQLAPPIDSYESMFCSKRADLCIIKLRKKLPIKNKLIMSNRKVRPGEDLIVIGHPVGLTKPVISTGIASSETHWMDTETIDGQAGLFHAFTMTTPISKGSSGSPIFSADGKIQGITVAYLKDAQNINIGINSTELEFLKDAVMNNDSKSFLYLEEHFQNELQKNLKDIKKELILKYRPEVSKKMKLRKRSNKTIAENFLDSIKKSNPNN